MPAFNVGDRVRCLRRCLRRWLYDDSHGVEGAIYTVQEVYENGFMELEGLNFSCGMVRFELIEAPQWYTCYLVVYKLEGNLLSCSYEDEETANSFIEDVNEDNEYEIVAKKRIKVRI